MDIKTDKRFRSRKSITKEKLQAVLKDIKSGAPNKHAAIANGMGERTLYEYIKQGICDLDHDNMDTLEVWFVKSLKRIELDEITECRRQIRADPKSHKGAEWTLEHAYMHTFSIDSVLRDMEKRLIDLEQKLKPNVINDNSKDS